MKKIFYGKTEVVLCDDAGDLGKKSAGTVAKTMRMVLAEKGKLRLVLAAGESQSTFLNALACEAGIDWSRVECFNIDDFWDVRMPEKFTCGYQTTKELYNKINAGSVNLVRYDAVDPEAECLRFEKLLRAKPIDILCQGIGTSGHLALNEPFDVDFNDEKWVRLVNVAEQSKKQLRADPNFKELGYIPEKGITMTIPAILSARHCYTMVPLKLKKQILTRLAAADVQSEALPATVLLNVNSTIFVDMDSCPDAWKDKVYIKQ
ncbi:MAG: 6-phosphogluconolactonase [Lentisphaerota bacterium]